MQFFLFFFLFWVESRLGDVHTIFWKRKKSSASGQSRLVEIKEYIEIYNRVKYFCGIFEMRSLYA